MIKTGDWTIAELIKYLVAVQSTLTPVELERLKMTSAIPRELREGEKLPENGKPPRQRASELYEPLDVFRALKLPVIDWGAHPKWRSNSEEGTKYISSSESPMLIGHRLYYSEILIQARSPSIPTVG